MYDLPAELTAGLATAALGQREAALGRATTGLIERYQADRPASATAPIIGSALQASAYLLYRMPATYAAVRSALGQLPDDVAAPTSQLDFGGGTGAALWAAADRWPDIVQQTVLDNAAEALRAGQLLASGSTRPSLRQSRWERWSAGSEQTTGGLSGDGLPAADLVTVSYLLSELDPPTRAAVLAAAARAARRLLVILEPGTRSGYRRILSAREALLADGWTLLAPCPHQHGCPMTGDDWCHFSARVNRSAVHRRLKQAELGYEDEKFSYLAFAREASLADSPDGRVLRHPRVGKGRISLTLCSTPPAIRTEVVGRSAELYRAARRTEWGDGWPPASDSASP